MIIIGWKGRDGHSKNVPYEVCAQCGEKLYTDEAAERLERLVSAAKRLTCFGGSLYQLKNFHRGTPMMFG